MKAVEAAASVASSRDIIRAVQGVHRKTHGVTSEETDQRGECQQTWVYSSARILAKWEWKHLFGDYGKCTTTFGITTIHKMYFTFLARIHCDRQWQTKIQVSGSKFDQWQITGLLCD